MVVVPEPAVKCLRALLARAVDGAVGPTGEHGADEALGLPVRLRPVGTGAAVADSEFAAGERVEGGDVGRAVVGQEPLDPDPVAPVEGERALQEADRGRRPLVDKYLRAGEPAVVVDADVDVLVADVVAALALQVGVGGVMPPPALASEGSLTGAALDPTEPLDVDVQELARPRALVAARPLEPQPAQLAEALAGEDPGNGRECHPEQLRDLGAGEAQPTHGHDQPHPLIRRPIGDSLRPRVAISQATLPLDSVPVHPFARAAEADTGSLGRSGQGPSLNNHPLGQPSPATPTERRVTVKPHPDLLLGAESAWQPSASKEARMDQPPQELQLGRHQTASRRSCFSGEFLPGSG